MRNFEIRKPINNKDQVKIGVYSKELDKVVYVVLPKELALGVAIALGDSDEISN